MLNSSHLEIREQVESLENQGGLVVAATAAAAGLGSEAAVEVEEAAAEAAAVEEEAVAVEAAVAEEAVAEEEMGVEAWAQAAAAVKDPPAR